MPERVYGEPSGLGGRVFAVAAGSAGAEAGIRPGDRVVAIDGQPVRDVLDWQWLADSAGFDVTVENDDGVFDLTVEPAPGEPLGITFDDVVFDGVRECVNACAFCFVTQLPAGMRPSLYVRDDDYRLSFLYGNFVTLTNMDEADIERVKEQRLSPLYVSLHAVDPAVRRSLVACTVDDTTTERMDELLDAGIELHVQIVAVPGVNDGDVLAATLDWLSARPGVLSVGIVPLGFTRHQTRFSRTFDQRGAGAVIDAIAPYQQEMRDRRGCTWVYAADEFYLIASREMPAADAYDDFPQFENGIGMVRAFADEIAADEVPDADATVVTGMLFAPVLERLLRQRGCAGVRVLAVENQLMGGNVSVTGLLGGGDIAAAIRADAHAGPYLVPDVVVNSDGLLLDDVPAGDLARQSAADVRLIGTTAGDLTTALAHIREGSTA